MVSEVTFEAEVFHLDLEVSILNLEQAFLLFVFKQNLFRELVYFWVAKVGLEQRNPSLQFGDLLFEVSLVVLVLFYQLLNICASCMQSTVKSQDLLKESALVSIQMI